MSAPITLDELDHMADVMRLEGTASEGRWSAYANRRLALPDWFDTKLASEETDQGFSLYWLPAV